MIQGAVVVSKINSETTKQRYNDVYTLRFHRDAKDRLVITVVRRLAE